MAEWKWLLLLLALFLFGVILVIDIGKARAGDDSIVKLINRIKHGKNTR